MLGWHCCSSFDFLRWPVHLLVHFLFETAAVHLPLGLAQFDMLIEHLVRDFSSAVLFPEYAHDSLPLGLWSRRGMVPGIVNICDVQVVHMAFAGLAAHRFVEGAGVLPSQLIPGALLASICPLHFKLLRYSRSWCNPSGIL